jgi:carboxymethylenebutenolidase
MKTEAIEIKTPDGVCDATLVTPGEGTYPAVLFNMDAFGPRASLTEMAETLAKSGYVVLVPNLFYRVRKAPVVDLQFPVKAADWGEAVKQIMPFFATFTPELAMRDAGIFLEFLDKQKHVKPGKVGLTGYCMGGAIAIRTAEKYPDRIAAVASFHAGRLVNEAPDSPHLLLKKIEAELYVAHADNDESMPAKAIAQFAKALRDSGIRGHAEVYPGASHGYTMKDLPAYSPAALDLHWKNLRELLKRNLY